MSDLKVKGTMLVDLVKIIRKYKDKNWDQYLKPEDWEIINKRILPSMWYPLELYQRCGAATFQLLAQGNPDLVRSQGRIRAKELFEGVYKAMIIAQDPMTTLDRFVMVYGQLFNFSTLKFSNAGKNHAKIYHQHNQHHPATMPYCYQLMGNFDVLVELAGGKNVKIELMGTEWEGASATTLDVTWE